MSIVLGQKKSRIYPTYPFVLLGKSDRSSPAGLGFSPTTDGGKSHARGTSGISVERWDVVETVGCALRVPTSTTIDIYIYIYDKETPLGARSTFESKMIIIDIILILLFL